TITQIYKTFFESRSNLRPAFRIRGLRTAEKIGQAAPPFEKSGNCLVMEGCFGLAPNVKYIKLSDSLFGPVSSRVVVGPSAGRVPTRRMMVGFARHSTSLMASATHRRAGGRHEGRGEVRRGHGRGERQGELR